MSAFCVWGEFMGLAETWLLWSSKPLGVTSLEMATIFLLGHTSRTLLEV